MNLSRMCWMNKTMFLSFRNKGIEYPLSGENLKVTLCIFVVSYQDKGGNILGLCHHFSKLGWWQIGNCRFVMFSSTIVALIREARSLGEIAPFLLRLGPEVISEVCNGCEQVRIISYNFHHTLGHIYIWVINNAGSEFCSRVSTQSSLLSFNTNYVVPYQELEGFQ